MGHRSSVIRMTAVAMLLGCASSAAFAPRALESAGQLSFDEGNRIMANDKWAHDAALVSASRMTKTANGKLLVEVELQSRVNYNAEFQVRTVFRDADAFPIRDDETGWQVVLLPAGSSKMLSYTSMSTKAEGYAIELRTAGAPR